MFINPVKASQPPNMHKIQREEAIQRTLEQTPFFKN